MILTFTDFGVGDSYLGEMEAVLRRQAPEIPVIHLVASAPAFRPDLAAYLLRALMPGIAPGDVLLGVVDPGVGSSRLPLALEVDGRWLVGPDNGLFELVQRDAASVRSFAIAWRPERLSASFHGRDLFAPVAARLARGDRSGLAPEPAARFPDWPDDLPAIVHADHYGNAITGLRAARLTPATVLLVGGRPIRAARTFSDVSPGEAMWYENSSGLVEIAVNGGPAVTEMGLQVGAAVEVVAG